MTARTITIVIGVAAAGVIALGAQTGTAAPDVVDYDTYLTLTKDQGGNYHGFVQSDTDHDWGEFDPATAVRKCMHGRRVVLFKLRPGADRKVGTELSEFERGFGGVWWMRTGHDWDDRVRARVKRKVRYRFVCRADRAAYHH